MSVWDRIRRRIGGRREPEPPCVPVFWTLQAVYLARAYYAAACLGIAEQLDQRAMTCAELAAAVGADEQHLGRLMRALAAFGVFADDGSGRFHMTGEARPLLGGAPGSLRDWIIFTGNPVNWQAYGYALESVKQGRSGFDLAHGETFYGYGREHGDFGGQFIAAMNNWTEWQCRAVVDAVDFSPYARVVDVGGGYGRLIMEILKRHANVRGVLCDQPGVVERTRRRLVEAGLAQRCELVGADITQSVPAGGDLYVIKHVLRDWDDARAGRILQSCRAAMPDGARLLIIDGIVDPANGRDRVMKLLDLEQMFWLSGTLRSWDAWMKLLSANGFTGRLRCRTAVVDAAVIEARKTG